MKKINIFKQVNIETFSNCNRECTTCLRQTASDYRWDGQKHIKQYLDADLVYKIIDELEKMEHYVPICFNFFNEPLLDKRTSEFVKYAKKKGFITYFNTNGDLLNEKSAKELDGYLNFMKIALYDLRNQPDKKDELMERTEELNNMFNETKLIFLNDEEHIITHFSPHTKRLNDLIQKYKTFPCTVDCQLRMIISYTGEMLLCCEDIGGNWKLGNIQDKTLQELWFSDKHQDILRKLSRKNGKANYAYCRCCPVSTGDHPKPNRIRKYLRKIIFLLKKKKIVSTFIR
jgi:radical SAM protein with 4Fe4S-binding SPASM domain